MQERLDQNKTSTNWKKNNITCSINGYLHQEIMRYGTYHNKVPVYACAMGAGVEWVRAYV